MYRYHTTCDSRTHLNYRYHTLKYAPLPLPSNKLYFLIKCYIINALNAVQFCFNYRLNTINAYIYLQWNTTHIHIFIRAAISEHTQFFFCSCIHTFHQFGGKRIYLYTWNNNQLDPFASQLTIHTCEGIVSRLSRLSVLLSSSFCGSRNVHW